MNTAVHVYDERCTCGRCSVETERREYQWALIVREWQLKEKREDNLQAYIEYENQQTRNGTP